MKEEHAKVIVDAIYAGMALNTLPKDWEDGPFQRLIVALEIPKKAVTVLNEIYKILERHSKPDRDFNQADFETQLFLIGRFGTVYPLFIQHNYDQHIKP